MTSSGLAIDLGENMTELFSSGIVAGYPIPLTTYLYLEISPAPIPRHGASCQEAHHGAG